MNAETPALTLQEDPVIPRKPTETDHEVLPNRTAGLIVEDIEDETIVYDPKVDRMHSLNPTAAFIFRLCDGATHVDHAARRLAKRVGGRTDARLVDLTLQRLSRARLIEPSRGRPFALVSRREAAKALGLTGALSTFLPVVISVVAPTAASAQTCKAALQCCTSSAECCPGLNCTGPPDCPGPIPKRCR